MFLGPRAKMGTLGDLPKQGMCWLSLSDSEYGFQLLHHSFLSCSLWGVAREGI